MASADVFADRASDTIGVPPGAIFIPDMLGTFGFSANDLRGLIAESPTGQI
jgi:hypothetical protein